MHRCCDVRDSDIAEDNFNADGYASPDWPLVCQSIKDTLGVWFYCTPTGHRVFSPPRDAYFYSHQDHMCLGGIIKADRQPASNSLCTAASSATPTPVAEWFVEYLLQLRQEVQARPNGGTVRSSSLTQQFVATGSRKCSECAERISTELSLLATRLADAVDSVCDFNLFATTGTLS